MLVYWKEATNEKIGEDEWGNPFYSTIEMFGEIVGAMDGTRGGNSQKLIIATPDGKFIEMPIYHCYHKSEILKDNVLFHQPSSNNRKYIRSLDSGDDVYTVEEWKQAVEEGSFNTFDGSGYWVKDGYRSNAEVFSTEPLDATHVVWFNK